VDDWAMNLLANSSKPTSGAGITFALSGDASHLEHLQLIFVGWRRRTY